METVLDTPVTLTLNPEHEARRTATRAAQAQARQLAERVNRVLDGKVLEVAAHPTVHLVEDGAFVEAVVWVPREA